MAKVDSNVEVKLKNVRLSFEHIFKAQVPRPDKDTGKVGPATFNCVFLLDKKKHKELILDVKDAIEDSKEKLWGKNPPKVKAERIPLKDGDEENYDGYEGQMFISARNQKAPAIIHSKREEDGTFKVLDGSEGVIYSGCYVNAVVRIYSMDHPEYGKRVSCSLEAVQFYADGEAFSGASRVDANAAFEGMEGKVDEDEDIRGSGRRRTTADSRAEKDRDREERPRGGRSSRDEDDKPAARRGRDRDDDEPAPRRGRDADEDEKPRSRSRERDDEDEKPAPRRSRSEESDEPKARPRSSRDDESDRPSRSRSRDSDDREDAPRSRRRSSEDDDAPAPSRSRRSSRQDEDDSDLV